MKTKLAVALGAVALAGVAALALSSRREPAAEVQRARPTRVAPVSESVEAPIASRGEKKSVEEKRSVVDPLPHSGVRSDKETVDLMGAPAKGRLPAIRQAFLESKDAKDKLRLAHVLIAQEKRFGLAMEIDREVHAFLESVLADPAQEHAVAISALARWETDASFETLGRVLANPEEQSDFAQAAEWLSESRNPKAVSTILKAFEATDDEDGKIVAANALLKLASETPELGLASVLRGQVRPALEKMLAQAESDWTKHSVRQMLEALP